MLETFSEKGSASIYVKASRLRKFVKETLLVSSSKMCFRNLYNFIHVTSAERCHFSLNLHFSNLYMLENDSITLPHAREFVRRAKKVGSHIALGKL